MKRLPVAVVAISLVLITAACGGSKSSAAKNSKTADDPNTKVIHVQVDSTTVACILWDGPGEAGSLSCGWPTASPR